MKLIVSLLYFGTIFLSLFVVTPQTFAISDSLVIYQVQTGGAISGTATEEIIVLFNSSEQDINVTNWCVEYRSASYNIGFSDCIEVDTATEIWLKAGGFITFASDSFLIANPDFITDFRLTGGMAATGGHVVLVNNLGNEVDKVGWGGASAPEGLAATPHIAGNVLSRNLEVENIDTDINLIDFTSDLIQQAIESGVYEVEVLIDVCPNIQNLQTELPLGFLQDEEGNCIEDLCLNVDGLQAEMPTGYQLGLDSNCLEIPLENRTLFITELLPNPPSYDTGLEFIEIFNPHNEKIDLVGYKIQVGPSYTKEFIFTDGYILPQEYLSFNDSATNITLPNSSGVSLRLVAPNGSIVSNSEIYSNAGDNVSWALVEDQWIYTNQITPDAANKPYLELAENEVFGVTSVLAPCPAGKYRNPDTNRCRNIETAVSQLTPCDEDEYRNPETNRCRKLVTSSTLTPCPEGQERNPDTNRCRKVSVLGVSSSDELPTVTDTTPTNVSGSINWGIISIAMLGTLGYMAYEWRSELGQRLVKPK